MVRENDDQRNDVRGRFGNIKILPRVPEDNFIMPRLNTEPFYFMFGRMADIFYPRYPGRRDPAVSSHPFVRKMPVVVR